MCFLVAPGILLDFFEFLNKLVELCIIGEAESIDQVQFKINPLTEFLRCFRKGHFGSHDAIDQCFCSFYRHNAVDVL